MIKDVTKDSILNGLQSIEKLASNSTEEVIDYPRMKDCFNISTINHGDAKNNTYHINTTLIIKGDSINVMNNESSTIVDITVTSEVFPNDKEFMKLIWKYLSFDDKKECSLVCKRFNDIISNMDCFRLVLKRTSDVHRIPKVSRSYKTLIIQRYQFKTLAPVMRQMLKLLSQSVVELTLDGCDFDLMTFSEFLRELPLLKSLKLNIFITIDTDFYVTDEELPNFSQLKDFEMKVNRKFKETFDIIGSALNLESITLFDAIFNSDLIDNLIKYKKSLKSLSLTQCIIEPPSYKTKLNTLHFDSSVNLPTVDFDILNCLENLRKIELINVKDEMFGILDTECVKGITNFKMIYNDAQSDRVGCFFNYFCTINRYITELKKSVDLNESNFIDDEIETVSRSGGSILEFSITKEKKTENLDENPFTLSFKVNQDRAKGNRVLPLDPSSQFLELFLNAKKEYLVRQKSRVHVRSFKFDSTEEESKLEYYKIKSIPFFGARFDEIDDFDIDHDSDDDRDEYSDVGWDIDFDDFI